MQQKSREKSALRPPPSFYVSPREFRALMRRRRQRTLLSTFELLRLVSVHKRLNT